MHLNLTRSSNLHRRKLCPGSARAEYGLPEEQSNDAAEGTLLHAILAGTVDESTASLTAEQEGTLEIARASHTLALEQIRQVVPDFNPTSAQHEVELVLRDGLEPILVGHCDDFLLHDGVALYIEDKKMGRIAVESADLNLQLSSYAVQGWQETGVPLVFVGINQPRLDRARRLSVASSNEAQLKAADAEIMSILAAAEAPDAPRIAGEAQCRYCRAKQTCPKAQAVIPEMASLVLHTSGEIVDNVTLEALYDKCGMAKKMIGEIEAEIKRRLEADPEAFGGRLGLKVSSSSVIEDTTTLFTRLTAAGARQDEIAAICPPPTKGSLEELLRKVTGAKGMALKDGMKQLLDGLTVSKPKAPSIERRA